MPVRALTPIAAGSRLVPFVLANRLGVGAIGEAAAGTICGVPVVLLLNVVYLDEVTGGNVFVGFVIDVGFGACVVPSL